MGYLKVESYWTPKTRPTGVSILPAQRCQAGRSSAWAEEPIRPTDEFSVQITADTNCGPPGIQGH